MFTAETASGHFCWVDLAATDAGSAKAFYGRLFGWRPREQEANDGSFTRLRLSGRDVASVYQMSQVLLDRGVPSHWTPYIRVDDVEHAARRAVALGGKLVIQPFNVSGVARIAIILDPINAHVGLWEPLDSP